MELGYAEKRPAKAVGVSKDPKMAKKRTKNDSFWGISKNNKKNLKSFYQIIDSCKKYSLSEVQETRNSKKIRPSWLYQAKNRSNIAKVGLK